MFGIREGDVRVVDWKVVVHQYPAKEGGEQSLPFTGLKLTLVQIDEKGNVVSEPDEKFYPVAWTNKRTGQLDFLPSDDGQTDTGDEPGAEGTVIIPARNGAKLFDDTAACKLVKSFEECTSYGTFPEDVSELNGLEGYVHTIVEKTKDGKDIHTTLFKKVDMDSLGNKKKKGGGKAAPVDVRRGKTGTKPAAADEDGDDGDDNTAIAAVLGRVVADLRKQGKTEVSDKVFQSRVTLQSVKLGKADQKALSGLMKGDEDEINAVLAEFNAMLSDGKLVIPEEE